MAISVSLVKVEPKFKLKPTVTDVGLHIYCLTFNEKKQNPFLACSNNSHPVLSSNLHCSVQTLKSIPWPVHCQCVSVVSLRAGWKQTHISE